MISPRFVPVAVALALGPGCATPGSETCGAGTRWDGTRCVADPSAVTDAGPTTIDAPTQPRPDGATSTPDASNPLPPDATSTPSGLRVFVSSLRYPANLQAAGGQATGLASADALCQGLADAAALGGTFRAWLSTSTVDAIDHIQGAGPWYRMDGAMAFPNHASLATTPLVSINLDEHLGSPDPYYEPWTGTALGGRHAPPTGTVASTTCLDWTSTSSSSSIRGLVGYYGEVAAQGDGPAWTDLALGYCSPFSRHLYCFEQ